MTHREEQKKYVQGYVLNPENGYTDFKVINAGAMAYRAIELHNDVCFWKCISICISIWFALGRLTTRPDLYQYIRDGTPNGTPILRLKDLCQMRWKDSKDKWLSERASVEDIRAVVTALKIGVCVNEIVAPLDLYEHPDYENLKHDMDIPFFTLVSYNEHYLVPVHQFVNIGSPIYSDDEIPGIINDVVRGAGASIIPLSDYGICSPPALDDELAFGARISGQSLTEQQCADQAAETFAGDWACMSEAEKAIAIRGWKMSMGL
jgi:hypothetical protein